MPFGGIMSAVAGAVVTGLMSDSQSSGGSASTQPAPTMTPEQLAALRELLAKLSPQSGDLTQQQGAYNQPFAAPLSNLQKLSLQSIENLSQEMGSSAAYQATNDALIQALQGKSTDVTDTFQKSIVGPMTKNFQDVVLPGVVGNFAGTGAYGSDRMQQSNLAMRDFNDSIAGAGANLAFNADNAAKNRQVQALGLAPDVMKTPLQAMISALGAGGVEQLTGQTELTGQYQNFLNQQTQRNTLLNALISALGLRGTENITTVAPGETSSIGPIFAGALNALGNPRVQNIFGSNSSNSSTSWGGTAADPWYG